MINTQLRAVSNTSLWVAALRATENEQPDPLFRDPYARALAGDQYDHGISLQGPDTVRPLNPLLLRTCFVDTVVTDAAERGVEQIVLFGAGMDTRAVRLSLPTSLAVFEIDFPETFAYKEPILSRHCATPSCRRVLVHADVADSWEAELSAAGLDPSRPTLWVLEGLLLYLTASQARALGERISDLAADGSLLCFDAYPAALFEQEAMAAWNHALQDQDTNPASSMDDPAAWCTWLGWSATVFDAATISRGYCPWVPNPRPRAVNAFPSHGWLVRAERRAHVKEVRWQ